jgi:hypothetical protein
MVARQALNNDGELLELALALTDVPVDTLVAALESGDTRLCDASLIALTRRSNSSFSQQRKLIGAIRRLIDSPANSQQRALAREALAAVQNRS